MVVDIGRRPFTFAINVSRVSGVTISRLIITVELTLNVVIVTLGGSAPIDDSIPANLLSNITTLYMTKSNLVRPKASLTNAPIDPDISHAAKNSGEDEAPPADEEWGEGGGIVIAGTVGIIVGAVGGEAWSDDINSSTA